jgi:hypothetical protein
MQANYQPHPNVTAPKRRQQEKWKSTSGAFCGETTTKTDYVKVPLPPHYVRFIPPWTRNESKLEGTSTQSDDYKNPGIVQAPFRRTAIKASPPGPDDR